MIDLSIYMDIRIMLKKQHSGNRVHISSMNLWNQNTQNVKQNTVYSFYECGK